MCRCGATLPVLQAGRRGQVWLIGRGGALVMTAEARRSHVKSSLRGSPLQVRAQIDHGLRNVANCRALWATIGRHGRLATPGTAIVRQTSPRFR